MEEEKMKDLTQSNTWVELDKKGNVIKLGGACKAKDFKDHINKLYSYIKGESKV